MLTEIEFEVFQKIKDNYTNYLSKSEYFVSLDKAHEIIKYIHGLDHEHVMATLFMCMDFTLAGENRRKDVFDEEE